MNNKNILEITIKKNINCTRDVAFWNYWDHEHLDVIHHGFAEPHILYKDKNFMYRVDAIKIPYLPFIKISTPMFMVQHNDNTLYTYATQLGIDSRNKITINDIGVQKCEIIMNYKFLLKRWHLPFKNLLKRIFLKWNERVWNEDYPVKIRRQKVLNMNFKDFVGLPNNILDRKSQVKIYKLSLPIRRLKNSTRDRHPLSIKYEK